MLSAPELVKLIKAHNKLVSITIPAKAKNDVNALVKIIEGKGYKVNHAKKRIEPKPTRGKIISLTEAEKVLPKEKTEAEKQQVKKKKEEKVKKEKEEKEKEIKLAKKQAVQEFKEKKKEAEKKKPT